MTRERGNRSNRRRAMAVRVVGEAVEVIGLASLCAVVGADERIRELVRFVAIRRALASPPGQMSQLVQLDSLLHRFVGGEVTVKSRESIDSLFK